MTLQQLVEGMENVFGKGKRQEIILEFDLAQKTLCTEVELLKESGELSNITSYTSWALPSDFDTLTDVDFYNSDSEPLYKQNLDIDFQIYVDSNGDKTIYFLSTTNTPLASMPATIDSIVLRYIKTPASITTIDSTVNIDEIEYTAMEAFVRKRMYSKTPMAIGVDRDKSPIVGIDHRSVNYWDNEYYRLKVVAKQRINNLNDTPQDAVYYNHAGNQFFLKKKKEATVNAVTIPSYSSLYTKYVRFSATSPSTLTEIFNLPGGFTGLSYAMDGNDVVVTSTAGFSNETWGRDNQHSAHEYISANEFRFTPEPVTAWGTSIMEIFEY